MKCSRTTCRFLLPLLFGAFLSICAILIIFLEKSSNDYDVKDLLRFDLLSKEEEKTVRVCTWSGNGTDFYLFLPSFADTDRVIFMPRHESMITIDGQSVRKGDDLSVLIPGRSYTLMIGDSASQEMTLTVMKSSNIPSLFVETSPHAMKKVHANKNHKEKASIVLLAENGSVEYEGNRRDEIKSRGNSSWYLDKKPYHLNLSIPFPLFGMSCSRHWILLANGYDKTNLINKLVYDFAGKTALPWTPECRYVDLFINGEYKGLYLLAEQPEFDTGRINPADQENSFLAEINEQGKENINHHFFLTKDGRCFKIVEPSTYKSKRFSSICQTLQQTEDAILSLTEDSPWPDILDLDSFARRYLVDEIFLNPDGDLSSSFYYWDASAQKMFAYPIWDYDLSCGNSPHKNKNTTVFPEQLYAKYTPYYRKLYANRVFFSRMTELYRTEFLPLLEALIEKELPNLKSFVARSNLMNTIRWAEMFHKMLYGQESVSAKISELNRFLQKRDAFLKTAWIDMKEYISVRISGNESNVIAVFIAEPGARVDSIPSPTFFGLADSNHWYAGGTDIPLDPNICLTDGMHLFSSPHSVRVKMVNQSDALDEPNGPVDYIIRLIRHDGEILIPLFCLFVILFVMSFYALLNGRKTGGHRK